MKGLKDFRRSLNKDRSSRGAAPTTYTGVRSATAATKQPPSKVIRATRDYRAHQPNELSFAKGDFFHVLNDSTHPEWFEAVNPITNARGHVPAAYFDVLTKTARPGLQTLPGPQSPPIGGPMGGLGGGGYDGGSVSLTLGLQHCNDAGTVPAEQQGLLYGNAGDFEFMNGSEDRQRFGSSQLLHDFVA